MESRDLPAQVLSGGSPLSWVVDAAVGALLVAVFWLPSLVAVETADRLAVGSGLAAVACGAVLLRWKLPVAAPLTALAATATGWLTGVSTDPMLAAAWCLYPLALRRGPRTPLITLLSIGALMLIASLSAVEGPEPGSGGRVVTAACAIGGAWLLGHVEARRLAATQHVVREHAAYERVRHQMIVAREVHDVVGHSLSVISAEAGVVRSLSDADEGELRQSLSDIEERARGALEEVQALVRGLRTGEDGVEGIDAQTETALPEVVTAARASGLEVESRIDLPDIPDGVGLVVVRVVQEALSNTVRHSQAQRCEVAIWPEGEALAVRIDDDGTGFPDRMRPGSGLTGMRERVEDAGGSLTVTNRLDGGTRVLARLPVGVAG